MARGTQGWRHLNSWRHPRFKGRFNRFFAPKKMEWKMDWKSICYKHMYKLPILDSNSECWWTEKSHSTLPSTNRRVCTYRGWPEGGPAVPPYLPLCSLFSGHWFQNIAPPVVWRCRKVPECGRCEHLVTCNRHCAMVPPLPGHQHRRSRIPATCSLVTNWIRMGWLNNRLYILMQTGARIIGHYGT